MPAVRQQPTSLPERRKEQVNSWHYIYPDKEQPSVHVGCTRQIWGGHTTVPTDPAIVGWNSEAGYRRNTFDLRARRSVFDFQGCSIT